MNHKVDYKTYCHYIADNVLQFAEGKEWDSEDWNNSYIDFKTYLRRISPKWAAKHTIEDLMEDFAKEFYLPASPATHSYWLKGHNGLDALIKDETLRVSERPGIGIAIQDHQYHGDWFGGN